MMRAKSFEMQKVRELGRKKAGDLKALFILWMGIIEDVFQKEGRECKDQKSLKT